jgi:hypothetical protein
MNERVFAAAETEKKVDEKKTKERIGQLLLQNVADRIIHIID